MKVVKVHRQGIFSSWNLKFDPGPINIVINFYIIMFFIRKKTSK